MSAIGAFIWDVDGTLAETEEAHRISFNDTFAANGLGWTWDVPTYRRLLMTTGGKERMRAYADCVGARVDDDLVRHLHAEKTGRYVDMVKNGTVALRPGVAGLIDLGRKAGIRQAVATTTSRPNVDTLILSAFGCPTGDVFDAVAAGDEVRSKKPAPDVYLLALERLGLPASDCIAFEDSRPGVASARAAGLRVVLCPSAYTSGDDFGPVDWRIGSLAGPLPADLASLIGPL